MKKLRLMAAVLAGALVFSGCGKEEVQQSLYTERTPGEAASYEGSKFISLAKGDTMELLLQPDQAVLRWQNKKTGEYLDTRLLDGQGNDSSMKADVVASFFNGGNRNDALYSSYTQMDSYTYGVENEGVSYEVLENGVRVVYDMGNNAISYKDFPAFISKERMEELVLQHLDAKQKKIVEGQYRLSKSGIYARKSSQDQPIIALAAKQLYELFYEVGKYTYEELEADNTEHNKLDDMPQKQEIGLAMDYVLDGDELVVSINTGEISYNAEYPLRTLDVLPYFLSTQDQDGYLFVPDGSGSLIYLDNGKSKEYQYTARYWGGDVLQNADTYSSANPFMSLPVYGIKTENYAVLGVIEEGAEVATLSAYVSGSYNNVPYGRVSLSFAIREAQNLGSYVGALVNYTQRKVSTDYYKGNIKLRYHFLDGDDANYSGMAQTYRDYLIEKGDLKETKGEEQAAFFLELLGAVDKEKYMAGIPYNGLEALTTFDGAQKILADMTAQDISNIKVIYKGSLNNGVNQKSAEKVSVVSELGGKSGLKKLLSYANSIGAVVYPDVQLQTVNDVSGFSKTKRSFFMNGRSAQIYQFSMVDQKPYDKQKDLQVFSDHIVSPTYLTTYLDKFNKSYAKLGIPNLSSGDFMSFIAANYKTEENISMSNALPYYLENLAKLGGAYDLVLSNPISLAYSEADYLTDIPMDDNDLRIEDASVPFVQMVLSGCKTYSSTNMNEDSYDIKENLMKAIETGSAVKMQLMDTETTVLEKTSLSDVFASEYGRWKDDLGSCYKEYSAFYDKVKGARILEHTIVDRAGELVAVTWSNNTTVLLNYSDADAKINGTVVPAESYVIK